MVSQPMPNDHDGRYKRLFSHPGFVSRLLESFVDEPFLRQVDLSTLELVNTTFVSKSFARGLPARAVQRRQALDGPSFG